MQPNLNTLLHLTENSGILVNMSSVFCISVIIGFLCTSHLVLGQEEEDLLQCYECSNLQDPKCGKTWKYQSTSSEAQDYLKTCSKHAVACKKLEYHDSLQGKETGGIVVTRSCWGPTEGDPYRPDECKEMFSGNVCYCAGSKCNGGQLIHASILTIIAALSPFVYKMLS